MKAVLSWTAARLMPGSSHEHRFCDVCVSLLYPQLPTYSLTAPNDAMCHVWTAPSWQGESSRCRLGRCSNVFGVSVRFTRPLAIMPSADQVPVKSKSTHSKMPWHIVGCPDRRIDRLCIMATLD